jgi:hypothetical protein
MTIHVAILTAGVFSSVSVGSLATESVTTAISGGRSVQAALSRCAPREARFPAIPNPSPRNPPRFPAQFAARVPVLYPKSRGQRRHISDRKFPNLSTTDALGFFDRGIASLQDVPGIGQKGFACCR